MERVENREELVVGVVKKRVAAKSGPKTTEAAVKKRESREADTFQVSQNKPLFCTHA